ncbi:MAG: hypothetical protein HY660_05130, partial [Armatimonadetes bacterium]|nr:hypothetical protein [Armatimonadota bacterium]
MSRYPASLFAMVVATAVLLTGLGPAAMLAAAPTPDPPEISGDPLRKTWGLLEMSGGSPGAPRPAFRQEIIVAQSSDADNMDPAASVSNSNFNVLRQLFDTLTDLDFAT